MSDTQANIADRTLRAEPRPYTVTMTPERYAAWQDSRGNVEDACAILAAVARERDKRRDGE